MNSNSDFIDLCNFDFPEIVQIFFDMLNGGVIEIHQYNLQQILDTIYFLEFDSISINNIAQNSLNLDITQLISFPLNSIEEILSSNLIHITNENQIIQFILDNFHEKQDFLFLLYYIYFGFTDQYDFQYLIDLINFEDINEALFNHFKSSLMSNYLLSPGKAFKL